MHNFLPKEEKKVLRKEYVSRLTIVALVFLFVAEIIGFVSLLPAFFISQVKEDQITLEQTVVGETLEKEKDMYLEEDLVKAQAQIAQLNIESKDVPITDLILKVTNNQLIPGIRLQSFTLMRNKETSELTLKGVALNRDSLVTFKKTLEKEPLFKKVDFPVSDLAKNRDIFFSVKVNGVF